MPLKDPIKRKEYHRNYQQNHKAGHNERQRGYYRENPEKILKKESERRKERHTHLSDCFKALEGNKCDICGCKENLEFHHVDPIIHRRLGAMFSWAKMEKLWEEFNRCRLICKKCHEEEHHGN